MTGGDGDSDRELVEAVRSGNLGAFSTLYARHLDAVSKEIRRTSDDASVVDMTQDVFVRALEALPSLRDPTLFRPWLLAIARRAAIDQRRTRRYDQPIDNAVSDELSDTAKQPDDVAELRELAGLVRGMVAGLSRRDATAVRLVVDLGFSPDELGPALGVSAGAARVILHRARRRLRDALVLELLVRRQIDGCGKLAPIHDGGDVVATAQHVRGCAACQEAARREVVGYDLWVQAGHAQVGLS